MNALNIPPNIILFMMIMAWVYMITQPEKEKPKEKPKLPLGQAMPQLKQIAKYNGLKLSNGRQFRKAVEIFRTTQN